MEQIVIIILCSLAAVVLLALAVIINNATKKPVGDTKSESASFGAMPETVKEKAQEPVSVNDKPKPEVENTESVKKTESPDVKCSSKRDDRAYKLYIRWHEDSSTSQIYLKGLTADELYNFNSKANPCDDYCDYDYCRLALYDIDKLDEAIKNLIDFKPYSNYRNDKIRIRIPNEYKAIKWIINNKSRIYKCRDKKIDFIYSFDNEKHKNVFYNISQDCFTEVYYEYAGYGAVDCAATYYDVHETDYSFDNESEFYTYGRELHKLFKRDYRYPLDDIRLAFLSEYFEWEHKFSFDFEKACDSHYEINESEFEKIRAYLRIKYKKHSVVEAIKEYISDYTSDKDASSESAIVYLLNQLNIEYQSFHFD